MVMTMKSGFETRRGDIGVLLLHGLSGTSAEVEPLGQYLAERGYSTLGPLMKGHGTSPQDLAQTTWQDWAEGALEAYEVLQRTCSKVFVGGLSMGADQALHLAAHHPVAGVISMAAPVRIPDIRFMGIAFFRFLQWRTSTLNGGLLDLEAPKPSVYPFVATKSLYELKKLMDRVRSELPRVTAPTLVIHGRKDSKVPAANAETIVRALGSVRKHLVYLDRSDHVVTMDFDKDIVFETVLRFIETDGVRCDAASEIV
jgi:carboxylesterase